MKGVIGGAVYGVVSAVVYTVAMLALLTGCQPPEWVETTPHAEAASCLECDGHSLRAYGAVGDGIANDAPALQAALWAVAAKGGGTIVLEGSAGDDFRIASPVFLSVPSGGSVSITGAGRLSRLVQGVNGYIEIGNAYEVLLADFYVINPASLAQPGHFIKLSSSYRAIVERTVWSRAVATTAPLHIDNCGGRISDTSFFGGSGGVAGILIDRPQGFTVENVRAVDGTLMGSPAFIRLRRAQVGPGAVGGAHGQNTVEFRDIGVDEAMGKWALRVESDDGSRHSRVTVLGLNRLLSAPNNHGLYAARVDFLDVAGYAASISGGATEFMRIVDCTRVDARGLVVDETSRTPPGEGHIYADALTDSLSLEGYLVPARVHSSAGSTGVVAW